MAAYEDALVQPLFVPWGQHLLERVGVQEGESLLDVACGPGTVALLAAARVGDLGSATGCDLSEEMLAIARAKSAKERVSIDYRHCPAESLPFEDDVFDVAVCQQGLQFFSDRVGALREIRRTVRGGGRVGISVWSEIEACEPFAALETAIAEVLGAAAATGFRNGPWGFADAQTFESVLRDAGYSNADVTRDEITVVFGGGVEQLIRSLAAAPVGDDIRQLDHAGRSAFHEVVRSTTADLIGTDGAIRGSTATNTAIATV
jgi:ubiquinone/menaquinone biosynthesis C-methylase UbiE